jgi:hypothetical protein
MAWLETGTLVRFNKNCSSMLPGEFAKFVGRVALIVERTPGYGSEIYSLLTDGEVIEFHTSYFDVVEVK